MSESELEKPVPDVVEQRQEAADGTEAEEAAEEEASLPLDVNEADAAEQRREVRLDEDDYR